jgi:hypothetical protein
MELPIFVSMGVAIYLLLAGKLCRRVLRARKQQVCDRTFPTARRDATKWTIARMQRASATGTSLACLYRAPDHLRAEAALSNTPRLIDGPKYRAGGDGTRRGRVPLSWLRERVSRAMATGGLDVEWWEM